MSKNQIIFGANYFIDKININSKGWIVWYKGQNGLTMSDCELIFTSFDKPTRQFTINRVELLKERTIHPTQKPVLLYKMILDLYGTPGMKILDTHLGSGSIAIACFDMGFDLLAFEKDIDYYRAAVKRFNIHKQQLKFNF